MLEWIKDTLQNDKITFVLGGIVVFITQQIWKLVDRKDRISKEKFSELKTIKKLSLTNKAHNVNRELTKVSFKADDNSSDLHKDLQGICYNHKSQLSWLIKLHNGGDHIDEWSKKLVTLVCEETLPGVEPQSNLWQGVPILRELMRLMKEAFQDEQKYVYISDVAKSLPDSDFKSLLDERTYDLGVFYVGSVKDKIYFCLLQFRRDGVQSVREKTLLKQWCQKTGQLLFKTNLQLDVLKNRYAQITEELNELEVLRIPKK